MRSQGRFGRLLQSVSGIWSVEKPINFNGFYDLTSFYSGEESSTSPMPALDRIEWSLDALGWLSYIPI